ncbi:MAG TPA: hypothetical protein VEQ58_08340, partial [Polyangiaceae bacterium]|nr:hypothetical protein [Polyangiaceae bacterium]
MAQAWRWLGAFSMLVACGGASGAPASSGAVSHAPRVAAVPALEDARRLRDEAEAMTAPPTPPISDRDESLAYLRGPLKEWIVRRRAAVDRAAAAYAEAFPRLNEAESAVAALELGELWRSFASTFVERGVSAVSPDIKSATLFGAYRAAIEDAAAPQLEQARLAYEKCASQAAAESKRTAARCRERLSKLTRRVEPAPAKRAAPSAGGHVIEPKRAWLTTRQPAPCTFAGSLRLPGAPISLEPNGEPFARLTLLELSQLELPPRRGEPLRLTSAWPIRATFYLGAEQLPFMPRNRIELVPKQVWLGGYAAVAAAEP